MVFGFLDQFCRHRFLNVCHNVHQLMGLPTINVTKPRLLWGTFTYVSRDRRGQYDPCMMLTQSETRTFLISVRIADRQFLRWAFLFFNLFPFTCDFLDDVYGRRWQDRFPIGIVKGYGKGGLRYDRYGTRGQILDIFRGSRNSH